MVRWLSLIDLYAAAILLAMIVGFEIPVGMLIFTLIILIGKSLISFLNPGGIIDVGIAVIIILGIFLSLPWWLLITGVVLIGQKGIIGMS